ncbi:GATA type zinc finger asd4 [Fusarium tjaetaba]|uniref:GATA type zinc finger asd4 n=1 Tax=Fusarium tjaetaba TaxID=1567544 RepID=A0A8H5VX77_9HYPO|nr:GATA type zinc finger asd4 [Fusarium tjaetaba]KAF5640877.1 GATA type zinc finger asd4 [Fusarium tjaetaba]
MEEDGAQLLQQTGLDPISRPDSTSTSASASLPHVLPGISALAAANAATEATSQLRASAAPSPAMYATASPAATSGGSGSTMPTCQNCSTSTTPLWRRDEFGSVLCNACGLFLKLHGRPRPISLKTDVIKSRNRVKTMRPDLANKKKQQQQQQQAAAQGFPTTDANGFDTTGHAAAAAHAAQAARRASQRSNGHDGADSPISRTGTPSMYAHGLSQFMVDDPYQTGFVATGEGRASSPTNGDRKMDAPQTHEQLIAHNSSLKTRVSELEVIIELFRGRLSQLEQQEAVVRSGQQLNQLRSQLEQTQESEAQLRRQLEDSHRRESSLKRRLDDLELELQAFQGANLAPGERPAKRPRTIEEPTKTQAEADIEAAAEALLASEASRPSEAVESAPVVDAPEPTELPQHSEDSKEDSVPKPEDEIEAADVPIDPNMPVIDDVSQPAVAEETTKTEDVEIPDAPDASEAPNAPEAAEATEATGATEAADASATADASPEATEGTETPAPATAAT